MLTTLSLTNKIRKANILVLSLATVNSPQSNYPVLIKPGPEVIKLFSCSTQLSMKVFLLINVEMPTVVGISTFMSRKNNILGLSEPEKCLIS